MALETIGESLIVNSGIEAFANAHANGGSMKPKYYVCISQDIDLSVGLKASDISGWGQHDIDFYHVVDNNSVQFTIDIPTNRSVDYIRAVALFFEDGTLYAVAKPVQVLPPGIHNTFTFELKILNQSSMLDFSYIAPDDRATVRQIDSVNDLTEALFMSGVKMVYVQAYGMYIYDDTKKEINDGHKVVNGWVWDDTNPHTERFLVFGDWQPMGAVDDPQAQVAVDFLHTVLDDMKDKHITNHRGEINAIFAGDLVDRAYGRDYDADGGFTDNALYTHKHAHADLTSLGFHHTYTVAGNHDVDGRTYTLDGAKATNSFELYEQYFGKRNYHVIRGNNLFIFLSPTNSSIRGAYSDETFAYWESLVLNNNDKNIFTTTHHPLYNVPNGNDETSDPDNEGYWYINDSKRFIDVLEAKNAEIETGMVNNHVAWFYGHIGGDRHTAKYGTQFLAVGMHLYEPKHVYLTYWVLDMVDGGSLVKAKLYDYWGGSSLADGAVGGTDGSFVETLNIPLKYKYKKNEFYFDSRWIEMATDDNIPKLLLNQASKDPATGIANKIDFVERGTRDEEDCNMGAGHGFGELARVAGGYSSTSVDRQAKGIDGGYFNSTSGVGGGWAVVRLSNVEDNFSCKMVLYASDERRGKDSLIPMIEIYPDGRVVMQDKVLHAQEFFSQVGTTASRLRDNSLSLFSEFGTAQQRDVVFNMYDGGTAWAISMHDKDGNELEGSRLRYAQEGNDFSLGGKQIIRRQSGSLYSLADGLDQDIRAANICGDTSVQLKGISIRCVRHGNLAHLSIYFRLEDFSVSVPNDIGVSLNLDIGRIAREMGWFEHIVAATRGAMNMEFFRIDGTRDSSVLAIKSKSINQGDVSYPDSLYLYQSELSAFTTTDVDALVIEGSHTLLVGD